MSFNRAAYDDGAYRQQLNQSVGVGNYLLGTTIYKYLNL